MILEYTLWNVEERHIAKINKDLWECGATDAVNQKEYKKVTLWKSDWSNAVIKDGIIVKAELKETEKNGFKNLTLYPERTKVYTGKPKANIEAAMEKKQEGIAKSQDRKESSIKLSSANRDATLMTVEWIKFWYASGHSDYRSEEVQKHWLQWRKWFLDNNGDDMPFI